MVIQEQQTFKTFLEEFLRIFWKLQESKSFILWQLFHEVLTMSVFFSENQFLEMRYLTCSRILLRIHIVRLVEFKTNYYNNYSPSHEIVLSCENVTELRREVTGLLQRLDVLMNVLSPVPQSAFPYFKLTYYAGFHILQYTFAYFNNEIISLKFSISV